MSQNNPESPAPAPEADGEALTQPQLLSIDHPCPYCVSSQKHALRHNPGAQVWFVRCLPHRLLQPVTGYLAEFAREATEGTISLVSDEVGITREEKMPPTFGQNPATLAWKVKSVDFAPFDLAPRDAALWGTVIAYLPVTLDNARRWTFYVLLSAQFRGGEYVDRKLGVAFRPPTGEWGYLPDPHVALALASCVGWQHLCVVHDTCTMRAITHPSHGEPVEDTSTFADLPVVYVQREDCAECREQARPPARRGGHPRITTPPPGAPEE